MALEAQAALAENDRAAQADAEAKKETALLIERERLRFVRRTIEAAELITKKALEILRQPYGDCTPDDAAKLFSVGHSIGSAVLNLPGANLSVQGLGSPASAVINVVMRKDAQSRMVDEIEAEYLAAHPDHPQAARRLRDYDEQRDAGNGG